MHVRSAPTTSYVSVLQTSAGFKATSRQELPFTLQKNHATVQALFGHVLELTQYLVTSLNISRDSI